MIKKIINSIIFIFFVYNSFASSNKSQSLNITSNEVKIIRDKNEIIFIDNVKAVQDKFTLYSDKMIVKYKEQKNKKMDIQSIKAEKNVKFINETITTIGDEGFYDLKTNIITMKKNIKAIERGITVFAEKFIYNAITGKANIIGNKKQNERVIIILDNIKELKN